MSKKMTFIPKAGGNRTFATNEERLLADIQRAIPGVGPSEYTVDGKPFVEALERLLGEDVTELQRDQAFKIYKVKNPDPPLEVEETEETEGPKDSEVTKGGDTDEAS